MVAQLQGVWSRLWVHACQNHALRSAGQDTARLWKQSSQLYFLQPTRTSTGLGWLRQSCWKNRYHRPAIDEQDYHHLCTEHLVLHVVTLRSIHSYCHTFTTSARRQRSSDMALYRSSRPRSEHRGVVFCPSPTSTRRVVPSVPNPATTSTRPGRLCCRLAEGCQTHSYEARWCISSTWRTRSCNTGYIQTRR